VPAGNCWSDPRNYAKGPDACGGAKSGTKWYAFPGVGKRACNFIGPATAFHEHSMNFGQELQPAAGFLWIADGAAPRAWTFIGSLGTRPRKSMIVRGRMR
jgi:hypothetical protein